MLQTITEHLRRFRRARRGISTVIVVMLSLVILVIVVGNVVLWSYQMNQVDWEKMQEKIDVTGAQTVTLNWTQNPSAYSLLGSTTLVGGSTSNLTADDGVAMTFRSYFSTTATQDYVDGLSNVDGSADKGTHSNFGAEKSGPDSNSDTLTEVNTSSGGVATFGSSFGFSYTTVGANQLYGSVFTSPSDAEGATLQSITWYGRTSWGSSNSKAVLVLASTKTIIAISNEVYVSTNGQERTNTFASPPTLLANTDYILMIIFDSSTRLYYGWGSSNQGVGDVSNSYASPTDPTDASISNSNQYRIRATYNKANYELDLEVQWTNVNYNQPSEMLCIYGGTMSSENLRIDVWTGYSWQNVFADLTTGWNNVSVSSYLTSQTFTIRFKGGTETSDTTQDSWDIDAVLLSLGSNEYTSEVEFTGVSNAEAWTLLNWTASTAWTTSSVAVTIQLYNFTSGSYQTSGFGYATYTSSGTPNTDENNNQTTSIRPFDFRDSTGNWKVKITGVKTGTTQFDMKVDFIEFNEINIGTLLTLMNSGSLTAHIVSVWVDNSTSHQRFASDVFLNSGETLLESYPAIELPSGNYTVKVATERGNVAVLPSS